MRCEIILPGKWVDSGVFETAIGGKCRPHDGDVHEVTFQFPPGCKIMVDAAVRLLSLANQLERSTRRVLLDFEQGEAGTMGYLNRMGFFEALSPRIEVRPYWPEVSRARRYRGTNADLVEIARINPTTIDKNLPSRLTDSLSRACSKRSDVKSLEHAAYTVFAELVSNIYDHSSTHLDGYAALQLYPNGNSLRVAVSDSGLGIMETLRPALRAQSPSLSALSDIALLVEVFRQGLSRHGPDHGCGLKGSAEQALKFQARLDVRLPQCRVLLVPSSNGYRPNMAYCYEDLPLLWGTHIAFEFTLDGD